MGSSSAPSACNTNLLHARSPPAPSTGHHTKNHSEKLLNGSGRGLRCNELKEEARKPPRNLALSLESGTEARGLLGAAAQRGARSHGDLRKSPVDGCHLLLAPHATAGA